MSSPKNQSSGSNTNSLEHQQANGQDVLTEKQNTTTVHLKVVWPEPKPPANWEREFHIILQSWLNNNQKGTEVEHLCPQHDGSVKIVITPESGQEDLFTKETQLTLKNQTTVLVKRVVLGGPSPAVPDIQPTSHTPSAPPKQNTTTVHLKVVWPEPKPPAKWERELHKALQIWLNNNQKGTEVKHLCPQDDGSVKIVITPESGQEDLFTKETQLTLKNQITVLVKRVVLGGPSPAVPDIQPTSHTPSAPPVDEVYNISLAHFSYLNQVHGEKLKRIEEKYKVQIQSVVTVSYMADPRTGGDPHQALTAFTELVGSASEDPYCIHYPHQPNQVDWEKTHQRIQKDQEKITRSSSDETEVSGATKSLENLNSKKRKMTENTKTHGPSSASEAQGASYSMSSRDPLVSSGLQIDPKHWAVIATALKKNLAELEYRFRVKFDYQPDNVKAKAEPEVSEDASIMESHAIRALLRLYQRVATSVMSCTLEIPRSNVVELEQMLTGHPGVVVDRQGDTWRIIGLPETLNQAVDFLETNIGQPVFRKEDKQKIRDLRSGVDSRGRSDVAAGGRPTDEEEDVCPICLDSFRNKTTLPCKHMFCKECLETSKQKVGPTCPVCKAILGKMVGDQPDGKMRWDIHPRPLPGFPSCGTIIIEYQIHPGKQTAKHPNPGRQHNGTFRTAYLPDNREGQEVLQLLRRAFDQKLIFTVGTSRTSGSENQVTWNDIHHKTSMYGGSASFGYPDPDYLQRVKKELKERGIE